MNCTEARHLIVPCILGELDRDSHEWGEIHDHLTVCQECAGEYQDSESVVRFICSHRTEFAEALREADAQRTDAEQIRSSWQCIDAKLNAIETFEKKSRPIRRLLHYRGAMAAAACIVLGLLAWRFVCVTQPRGETPPRQRSRPFTIELLAPGGPSPIEPGSQIVTSEGQVKKLLINRDLCMLVNSSTTLSIRPHSEGAALGSLVDLRSGEIFARVCDDGYPFVVRTAHGQAVVEGTTLDVRATDEATTLVVVEGKVHFASKQGFVRVQAGQTSTILGRSRPSAPERCDWKPLVAWTAHSAARIVAARQQHPNATAWMADAFPTDASGAPDIERIDVDRWLEKKRDWFEREFPWIFELQRALAGEGHEVDYARLLVESGDLWPFTVLQTPYGRIATPDAQGLRAIAATYGFDQHWLREHVSALGDDAGDHPSYPIPAEIFARWAASFEAAQDSPGTLSTTLLLNSLHAATYLANTRTLVWLYTQHVEDDPVAADADRLSALLRRDVAIANDLIEQFIQLLAAPYDHLCDEYRQLLQAIQQNITEIAYIEGGIQECWKAD